MKPRTKLRLTNAAFWAILLGAIALTTNKLCADEGREHERDRDDGRNECLVPEASTLGVAALGVAFIACKIFLRRKDKE